MADPRGFINTPRELPKRRPVDVRIKDWKEVYQEQDFGQLGSAKLGRAIFYYSLSF